MVAAFPVIGWQAIVGEQPICLMRVGYVRNPKERDAVQAGRREPPIVPLGFTADQCREFAADLLKAAEAIDGGRGTN